MTVLHVAAREMFGRVKCVAWVCFVVTLYTGCEARAARQSERVGSLLGADHGKPSTERAVGAESREGGSGLFVDLGASETDTSLVGLEALGNAIGDARLVQLGESSHGVAEFAVQRGRIIRYLHEQKGFNVVALEAPLYDCEAAGQPGARPSATSALLHCAFPVWTVSEVEPLFQYLRGSEKTARPLHLTGFDVQVYGSQGSVFRPAYLRQIVSRVDQQYARQVYELDSSLVSKVSDAYNSGRELQLTASEREGRATGYTQLLQWLGERDGALARAGVSSRDRLIARQLARSATYTLGAVASAVYAARFDARDEGMAANIKFLLDSLYPGQRIIVWAHNEHIRYGLSESSVGALTGQTAPKRMGSWLLARRSELFTLGLYMRRGDHRLNDGQVRTVSPPLPGSLEERFGATGHRVAFVDLRAPGAEEFNAPMSSYLWGSANQRLVLRNEYDGLLMLDSVGPSMRLRQPSRARCCPVAPMHSP